MTAPGASPRVGVGVVTDRKTTAAALAEILGGDAELHLLGTTDELRGGELLAIPELRVLIVNLSLAAQAEPAPGVAFIRRAKSARPDVGVLSLKRQVDEHQLRAALDAGADACCLAVTPGARIRKAIKVVADGATWLDPEVAHALFHDDPPDEASAPPIRRTPQLSPRERQIIGLLVEGYGNQEIADHLRCAYPTVRTHLVHLYRKLGVGDRVSAAVFALRHGLT